MSAADHDKKFRRTSHTMDMERKTSWVIIQNQNDPLFADRACHRQVLSQKVYCDNKDNGCRWTGELGDMNQHQQNCQFEEIDCPRRCGKAVVRGRLEEHLENCEFVVVRCRHCQKDIIQYDFEAHVKMCLANNSQACPLKCGVKGISKEELTKHIHSDCPLLVIPCQFADTGCTYKTERLNMGDHLKTDLDYHLDLLCKLVFKQKRQLDQQAEQIRFQQNEIQQLGESLQSKEQEIAGIRSATTSGELIWKITDVSRKISRAKATNSSEPLYSEPFYTHPYGYKIVGSIWLNGVGSNKGKYVAVALQVREGEFDSILKWPMNPKFTFTLIDQNPDSKQSKDLVAPFVPQVIMSPTREKHHGKGATKFIAISELMNSTFIKDDTIYVKFSVNLKPNNPKPTSNPVKEMLKS